MRNNFSFLFHIFIVFAAGDLLSTFSLFFLPFSLPCRALKSSQLPWKKGQLLGCVTFFSFLHFLPRLVWKNGRLEGKHAYLFFSLLLFLEILRKSTFSVFFFFFQLFGPLSKFLSILLQLKGLILCLGHPVRITVRISLFVSATRGRTNDFSARGDEH